MRPPEMGTGFIIPSETRLLTEDNPSVSKTDQVHRSVKRIKTIPGKGWFVHFRINDPEKPAFDGTWKPGDFELVK